MALRDHVTLRGFSSQRESTADDEAEQHFSTCQSFAKQQTGSSCTEPPCSLNTNLSLTTTCAGSGSRDAGSESSRQRRRDPTHTHTLAHTQSPACTLEQQIMSIRRMAVNKSNDPAH